ncbi:MAG: peptidoglycan recognition family protein [Verrucomicrobiales bacterium]
MGKPRKSNQNVIGVLPAVIASVTVVVCYCILTIKGSRDMGKNADPAMVSGGFLVTQAPKAFQRLEKRREGRGSHSELNVRLPDPAKLTAVQSVEPLYGTQSLRSIEPIWQPSDETKGSGWAYLTSGIRREIDAPGAERRRWDGIVLHQSSTRGGNGAMLALYHDQVLGLGDGLAYHFVIGNGIYSSAGLIEVGERWSIQAPAGSPASDSPDPRSISICLIGDFSDEPPKPEQLDALDELIHYLRAKLGNIELRSHHRSNDGMTSCPGRYFPRESFI